MWVISTRAEADNVWIICLLKAGTLFFEVDVACDLLNNGSKVTDYTQARVRPRVNGREPSVHQV